MRGSSSEAQKALSSAGFDSGSLTPLKLSVAEKGFSYTMPAHDWILLRRWDCLSRMAFATGFEGGHGRLLGLEVAILVEVLEELSRDEATLISFRFFESLLLSP